MTADYTRFRLLPVFGLTGRHRSSPVISDVRWGKFVIANVLDHWVCPWVDGRIGTNVEIVTSPFEKSPFLLADLRGTRFSFVGEEACLFVSSHRRAHVVREVEVRPSCSILALVVRNKSEDLPLIIVTRVKDRDVSTRDADACVLWRKGQWCPAAGQELLVRF